MTKEKKSMAEVHAIMERLHSKRSGMSPEDVIREIREVAEKAKTAHKVTLKKQSKATVHAGR